MVNIGLRVLARPDQTMLPKIYQQLGRDYDERVLPSIINEVSFINYRYCFFFHGYISFCFVKCDFVLYK